MEYVNALLGGIGLFLVGMWLMTDGLKLAAGDALRSILHNWTKTPGRGLITGFSITALVQSSSAITVATIGFANAGLIKLQQAVWVIFGSNIGTTMTGWLVAMIGFKINLETYALPLIGIGMIMRMIGNKSKLTAVGQTVLGFGLFFLGISVLKEAFMGLGSSVQLPSVTDAGLAVLLIYLLLGLVLTTLMQSSSAAIVVTLSAAEGGLIPLSAAAATVIGTNLGTTSTALISVWGATPTAKRVAASHILFNIITACIAIIMMTPILWLVATVEGFFNVSSSVATTLAIFHTVFNILGVLLMWPLAKHLIRYLKTQFVSKEEIEGKPKYLDKNVISIPAVATDALFKELININEFSIKASTSILSLESPNNISLKKDTAIITNLTTEVGKFVADLSQQDLSDEIAKSLPEMILIAQQYALLMDLSNDIIQLQKKIDASDEVPEIINAMGDLRKLTVQTLENTLYNDTNDKDSALTEARDNLESTYESFKLIVFKAGAQGQLRMVAIDALVHQASLIKRMGKLGIKTLRRMRDVNILLDISTDKSDDEIDEEAVT